MLFTDTLIKSSSHSSSSDSFVSIILISSDYIEIPVLHGQIA